MPALADGWTIGKPDAVFTMTEDFKIPAAGTIEYNTSSSGEPAGEPWYAIESSPARTSTT